jgi:predicted nucleic acid-binding protein
MPEATQKQSDTTDSTIIILLDNNVVQAFLNKDTAPHLSGFLEEVEQIGATLAVSDITLYEALKAIIFDTKKATEVANFIDHYLTRYLVDDNVMINAARVHELYGSDKATKSSRHSCSTEDIINATTSMLLGAYILTSDGNDYPMPFFKEVSRIPVYFEVGNRRNYKVFYLLQPVSEAITDALSVLEGTNVANQHKTTTKSSDKK